MNISYEFSKRVFPKVRTKKGIASADYMQTLGHCEDKGENLEILKGGRKTSWERATSLLDEKHPNSDITVGLWHVTVTNHAASMVVSEPACHGYEHVNKMYRKPSQVAQN